MARTEAASESVESVRFSFYTDEEVRKLSYVKVTNPIMVDGVGSPVPGGLYDRALGPMDERVPCKSCGQISSFCPGHCGHIELVSPVYNPLVFDMLAKLLQTACFFCCHFKAEQAQVDNCASRLKLILKGDVIGAKMLESVQSNISEDDDGSYESCSGIPSEHSSVQRKPQALTSFQFTEAMSVLGDFLKTKFKKCRRCKAKNPTISKPTFGWFHMGGMAGSNTRQNVILGAKLPSSDTEYSGVVSSEGEGIETIEQKSYKKQPHDNFIAQNNFFSKPLLPSHVRRLIKNLWENEAQLCSFISDIYQQNLYADGNRAGYSMFFMETILVAPIKFRPPAREGDSVIEHPQTLSLVAILQANNSLGNSHNAGSSEIARRWRNLQQSVNMHFDSKKGGQGKNEMSSGICQSLEKKEGVFRQKLMGKRVNYACRSVISPDPYLAVNEIGIPPYFALRLTYPERLTPWNVAKLRQAIINGPEIHPGATHYVDNSSTMKLSDQKKSRISVSRKLPSSRGAVIQPGKNCDFQFEGKVVCRHLQDGDIVLVNRQPTLHKASIMAHVVRVLKGEKTLRMHYSNCSAYNADFDGDEMNVHFPQDEISRAEAYNIVHANNQYIVPTSGAAKRGLIQDHIVSSVLLTKKDTFLTRDEYNQLLYGSGVSNSSSRAFFSKPGCKVSMVDHELDIQPLLPAVWKPAPRWTGKQVITAVLNHITRGSAPFTVEKDGKIPRGYFESENDEEKPNTERKPGESKMLVYKNELVHGVIDQAQFGNNGLVHTVQEVYGSNIAGFLLSVFSRLFTVFLQMHGFTCGVDDLLILQSFDSERLKRLEDAGSIGEEVHCEFLEFKDEKKDPFELQMETEKFLRSKGESGTALLDMMMSSELNKKTSKINKKLLRDGLLKPFPGNCISLMTTSGAKGSTVNFSQISSFLGQQALEGKRVPRMISGKTLPCFPPWDCAARAGGFISDCFLTGLRPQEYYFHCMAGREGLVDTAVKTSRSGYLQRCLIKNMESLKVCYDLTVRDADGSIVQFSYGEDGIDVHQINFLTNFNAMAANQEIFHEKFGLKLGDENESEIDSDIKKLPFVSNLCEQEENLKILSEEMKKKIVKDYGEDLFSLVKHKYFSSLAQPGEPVGVIAAQSVGEPSTQMTLNTFHLAGRGEVNVTLGIPRLQEILMRASSEIKTPIMICPLAKEKSKDDGEWLAAKFRKVTLADITESIEVRIIPITLRDKGLVRVYKLKLKLYDPKLYPSHSGISLEECQEALICIFIRELEDAIQSHLVLHSRISGIKNLSEVSQLSSSPGADEDDDDFGDTLQGNGGKSVEDDDDDDGTSEADDIGLDEQKRKQQVLDEIDYQDASASDSDEGSTVNGKMGTDQAEGECETSDGGETGISDIEVEASEVTKEPRGSSWSKSGDRKTKTKMTREGEKSERTILFRKQTDRLSYHDLDGLVFEAHFEFTNEPHILLAQIAQKAAKKVLIKSCGKITQCEVKECSQDEILIHQKDYVPNSAEKRWALQTAGVDFSSFWQILDDSEVGCVYSNSIHAMLNTYGVEAARATIVKEINNVFKVYGVAVNLRHLYLIADYMTHSGGYRPMNRLGAIAESISPLSKMSFETAAKFIAEAALHGDIENLEAPSARICLGMPVKMGTGSFDLLQKLDV